MYKVALKRKDKIQVEFETLERAINYALWLESKRPMDTIFILDENGKDITHEIEY